jgi:amino acid transporter
MFFTIFLNGALGFAMILAILFCIGDVNNAMSTPTGYPFIEIFKNATQSKTGATAMTSILISMIIFATFGYVASASRQLWAFAREFLLVNNQFHETDSMVGDMGLPFSDHIARVSVTFHRTR